MTIDRGQDRLLVVDLDRALLRTDPSREAFWAALGENAGATMRARTPAELAEIATLRTDLLPVNPAAWAQCESRRLVLISGAGQALAQTICDTLALGPALVEVIAITPNRPTRAAVERDMIDRYGAGGFDLLAGALTGGDLKRAARTVENMTTAASPRAALREMRPHQWVKNGLLLLPLFAAHALSLSLIHI